MVMEIARDSCIIEKVQGTNSPFSPIIVDFDHGHSLEIDSEKVKCDVFVNPSNHLEKRIVVDRNGQNLIGKLPPEEKPLSQSLILIRNKNTNKARLVLTNSCNLVNALSEEESMRIKKKKPSKNNLTQVEKRLALNFLQQNFGSKKSKRMSDIGFRMDVDISGKESEIKQSISNIDVRLNEVNNDSQGNEDLLKLIPPCNRETKVLREVYVMDDIINASERESLKVSAEFLIHNGLKEEDEKSSFFLYSHYPLLGDEPDLKKVILLLYANTLYKFFSMHASELKKKNITETICPSSRPVALRVLNDFTVLSKSGRTRPSLYRDKLVCYIMVLILLVADYKINLDTLSLCLKGFGFKKLIQLARVVGIVPLGGYLSASKNYVLKIPLPPLPRPRVPKKKLSL